jgi:glycosyltransferase involved in cell wall biosynthesis
MALGLAESDIVMLVPGESTLHAKLLEAMWAVSILNVMEPKHRLLVWGQGRFTRRLVEFAASQKQSDKLIVAEKRLGRQVEFEELLAAADAVMITADGPVSTLPIAICMAAALPIVSTVTSEIAELLEDRHTALLVAKRSPKTIAQRLQDLLADKGQQWKLADMAKTEAYEFFSHTRFLNQSRGLYQQVAAGGKVDVPEIAPGAGMRFHGLA